MVILKGPGACSARKRASWAVSLLRGRSLPPTAMPGRVSFSTPLGLCHSNGAGEAATNPSTASTSPLMKSARRYSPSLKTSIPTCFCISSTSRMALSSTWRNCSAARLPCWYCSRASSSSGGRNRLPTWSARIVFVMVWPFLPGNWLQHLPREYLVFEQVSIISEAVQPHSMVDKCSPFSYRLGSPLLSGVFFLMSFPLSQFQAARTCMTFYSLLLLLLLCFLFGLAWLWHLAWSHHGLPHLAAKTVHPS